MRRPGPSKSWPWIKTPNSTPYWSKMTSDTKSKGNSSPMSQLFSQILSLRSPQLAQWTTSKLCRSKMKCISSTIFLTSKLACSNLHQTRTPRTNKQLSCPSSHSSTKGWNVEISSWIVGKVRYPSMCSRLVRWRRGKFVANRFKILLWSTYLK